MKDKEQPKEQSGQGLAGKELQDLVRRIVNNKDSAIFSDKVLTREELLGKTPCQYNSRLNKHSYRTIQGKLTSNLCSFSDNACLLDHFAFIRAYIDFSVEEVIAQDKLLSCIKQNCIKQNETAESGKCSWLVFRKSNIYFRAGEEIDSLLRVYEQFYLRPE